MNHLSQGNYVYYSGGTIVQIKELHKDNIVEVCYPDGTLVGTPERNLRFIELTGSNVLLRLKSEGGLPVFSLLKTVKHLYHMKEDYSMNIAGMRFFLSGFIYEDKSIWNFSHSVTLHYLHQLQNLVSILNADFQLYLPV